MTTATLAATSPFTFCYYVSTGRLNAMYTLRMFREGGPVSAWYTPDFYLCNLSTDPVKAAAKAEEYVARIRGHQEGQGITVNLCTESEYTAMKRRGNLSARQTHQIATIESGVFPFGKHGGAKISEAPASYLLWFADKAKDPSADAVIQALAAACYGAALEAGHIAARQAVRDAQAEVDALSCHVGTVGQRLDLTGTLFYCFMKVSEFDGSTYFINKLRVGSDIVVYIGNQLGEKGETITLRATVKKHDEYKGVKTTTVNRPKVSSRG
jgi:hypothetical protein